MGVIVIAFATSILTRLSVWPSIDVRMNGPLLQLLVRLILGVAVSVADIVPPDPRFLRAFGG